jgi:hypothetical protein
MDPTVGPGIQESVIKLVVSLKSSLQTVFSEPSDSGFHPFTPNFLELNGTFHHRSELVIND